VTTPKDLRDGAKAALVNAGVATAPQVFMSKMPSAPDKAIVLTWYPVALEHREGLQVRVRGLAKSTTSAEDWADQVKDALHGLHDLQWGDTHLELLHYVSGARMGFDGSDRDEVALNFYAVTSAPSISLVDID
jgi:hypothetical protein